LKLTATIHRATYPLVVLRQRNFSFVWSSMTLAAMGSQMEGVVLGWYVYELTDSPLLVGLVAAARMALNFLALFAGAVADRVSRQRLLACVELVMTCLAGLMLVLILSGRLEVWHIFAMTLAGGLVRMFQMPAAQSLVADTLASDRISNGVALTTMGRNFATIVGPLVGGYLFDKSGPQGAYSAIAILYCLSGVAALLITAPRSAAKRIEESVLSTVVQGLRYVKSEQVLWATLLLAVIINLTGWPLHTSLMPVFARDVLGTGAAGLGILMSAFGIGAIIGSVSLAMVQNLNHLGKFLIASIVAWHCTMFLFAASTTFPLSLGILVVTGMAFSATQIFMTTVLLRTALPEFRGRVMGLRVQAIFAYALGSPNSGLMAGVWGAPWAANFNAVLGIGLVSILAFLAPKLRRV